MPIIQKRPVPGAKIPATSSWPRWGGAVYLRPQFNQASKISARFGGDALFAQILGVSKARVYGWQCGGPKGTDGLIPACMRAKIEERARLIGLILTDEDWAAERIDWEEHPVESIDVPPLL